VCEEIINMETDDESITSDEDDLFDAILALHNDDGKHNRILYFNMLYDRYFALMQ